MCVCLLFLQSFYNSKLPTLGIEFTQNESNNNSNTASAVDQTNENRTLYKSTKCLKIEIYCYIVSCISTARNCNEIDRKVISWIASRNCSWTKITRKRLVKSISYGRFRVYSWRLQSHWDCGVWSVNDVKRHRQNRQHFWDWPSSLFICKLRQPWHSNKSTLNTANGEWITSIQSSVGHFRSH